MHNLWCHLTHLFNHQTVQSTALDFQNIHHVHDGDSHTGGSLSVGHNMTILTESMITNSRLFISLRRHKNKTLKTFNRLKAIWKKEK